jgi:hypothetical protein
MRGGAGGPAEAGLAGADMARGTAARFGIVAIAAIAAAATDQASLALMRADLPLRSRRK